jgi:hypothetical protein
LLDYIYITFLESLLVILPYSIFCKYFPDSEFIP